MAKIARVLPRFSPNFITILGLLPPVLFYWLVGQGRYGWALVALAATVLDSVDGAYARATGQVTKFGAVLDASLDRFSDALVISSFAFAEIVSWPMAIALVICSFLISYVKASAAANGIDTKHLSVGPIERQHRLAIIFVGLALYAWALPNPNARQIIPLAFIILISLSLITILRRLVRAKRWQ